MKFAIRDDDTCYFTKPEQLERVYGKIWDKIPISLAVVPFHACTKSGNVPREYWSGDKIFPIGENEGLVNFLKEKVKEGKVSIMLHGYNHKDYKGGPEFVAGGDLFLKVKKGKEYLETLFDVEIMTFVPPHNALSIKGAKAVIENNMNILGSLQTPFNRPFSVKNCIYFLKRKWFEQANRKDDYRVVYPFVMQFKNHKEFSCNSLIPSTKLDELIYNFENTQKHSGNFCLTTHHWEFSTKRGKNMFKILEQFWEYVINFNDIEFVAANEIFKSSDLAL
ncbi:hypothetical protein ES705_22498 [subsurface metagenome]